MRRGGVCIHKTCGLNSAEIEGRLLFGFEWVNPCLERQTQSWVGRFSDYLYNLTIFEGPGHISIKKKNNFALAIRKIYGFSVQPSKSLSWKTSQYLQRSAGIASLIFSF